MGSKVFIANLSAGGVVTTAFANTLSASIAAIVEFGASWRFMNVDSADVVMARNLLAHTFLQDTSFDYILFIDSDMHIAKNVLQKMFARDVDITGAAYTMRARNWDKFHSSLQSGTDPVKAIAEASSFNVHLIPGDVTVQKGFCKVAAFGFGYVLIKRQLFQRMIDSGVTEPLVCKSLRNAGMSGDAYDFFGLIPQPNGDKLSEDYSFCKRVMNLGDTDIHAYVGKGVSHVGKFEYEASFIEWLKSKATRNNK